MSSTTEVGFLATRMMYRVDRKLDFLQIHEAYVRIVVPPEKLHFYSVREGLEPLCRILNCPIPDEPFPRVNDAEDLKIFFDNLVRTALWKWAQIFGILGAVAVVIWVLFLH